MGERSRFSRKLKKLIRQEYGTAERFADVVGLSPGRISQIASGNTNLTFASLEVLMRAFPLVEQQERLYDAWLESCAPSPMEIIELSVDSSDEELSRFFTQLESYLRRGHGRKALETTLQLWSALKLIPDRYSAALKAGRALVETLCFLDRRIEAVRIAQKMAALAMNHREPGWQACALWLELLASRPLDPASQLESGSALWRLEAFLDVWQPLSSAERTLHRDMSNALARDRVAAIWDASRHTAVEPALLQACLEGQRNSYDHLFGDHELAVGLEVEARALVLLGDYDSAHLVIESASRIPDASSGLGSVKLHISRLRLAHVEGDKSLAEKFLDECLAVTEEGRMFHYRNEVMQVAKQMRI